MRQWHTAEPADVGAASEVDLGSKFAAVNFEAELELLNCHR